MSKTEKKPDPLHLSWEDITQDTRTLVEKFHEKNLHFKSIVAISRGGLVPATLVAQLLHLHIIDTVCIKTYKDFRSKEGAGVLKPLYYPDGGEGVLVIDDLTDSGLTIMYLRKMLPKAHMAVLYAKPEGENLSDTFVKEVPQETWLIFPWEINSHHEDFMPDDKIEREYELNESEKPVELVEVDKLDDLVEQVELEHQDEVIKQDEVIEAVESENAETTVQQEEEVAEFNESKIAEIKQITEATEKAETEKPEEENQEKLGH